MLDGQLDEDMRELCQEEFTQAKKDLEQLEEELKILLLAPDPNDDKDVIVEIRRRRRRRGERPLRPLPCSACTPCTPTAGAGR